MERQPTDWEKIFANNGTNKGLVSKIYKQLVTFNGNPLQYSCLENPVDGGGW